MKSPLAIVLLLATLAVPVALFLLLASQAVHLNGWVAAAAAVAAGWALNVAWALAVEKAESKQSPEDSGNTLAIAARFGWACPAVLVLLTWLVSPAALP